MSIPTTIDMYSVIDDFIKKRLQENTSAYRELQIRGGVANDIIYDHFEVKELRFLDTLQSHPAQICQSIIDLMPDKPILKEIPSWKLYEPYYDPVTDSIILPDWYMEWKCEYIICFHELIKATGHIQHLDRIVLLDKAYSDEERYACEEMIATIGSLYLQAYGGIVSKYFDNSIAYIQQWMKETEHKEKLLAIAFEEAKEAARYILKDNPVKAMSI